MSNPSFTESRVHRWLPLVIATAAGVIFWADLETPYGLAFWVVYLPLCCIVALFDRTRDALLAASLATILIVLGGYLSPHHTMTMVALENRLLEAGTIWLSVASILVWRRTKRRVEAASQREREATARLSSILDTADDGIISTDDDFRIVLFNRGAERIFGYAAAEAIGQPLSMLLPPAARASHGEQMRAFGRLDVQARRMGERGAVAGLRKDGTAFAAEISISKTVSSFGMNFTAILRDISKQLAIEQELENRVVERTTELREEIQRREQTQVALVRSQKLQAVGELAGGMAHNFNNLLTVISGNLELLGLHQLDAKARDLLRRASEAANMGARLTDRLLAIGRKQRLQPIVLNLNEIAQSMSDVLKRTLGDAIEIRTSFASDLWPMLSDVSEVENAILNIAINARDAMPNGGKLLIETSNKALGVDDVAGETGLKPGAYVMLSISDTGIGIPPALQTRVFEPFFTTKEAGRGTGLGLSTIYGFAKQSGGHLTIYSEVGKGTSVRLYLPRASLAPSAVAVDRISTQTDASQGETVLVVEDNPDVREITCKRLDMLGYLVVRAESGPAAVAILQSPEKIDLVFSDVVMPGGMSGFDLARWVRLNRPTIRILLTSGFSGEIASVGENDPHEFELLRKPYAIAELARAIRETLSG
jgi:PAS domain S-box-containing protein